MMFQREISKLKAQSYEDGPMFSHRLSDKLVIRETENEKRIKSKDSFNSCRSGTRVPADMRLLYTKSLRMETSWVTDDVS